MVNNYCLSTLMMVKRRSLKVTFIRAIPINFSLALQPKSGLDYLMLSFLEHTQLDKHAQSRTPVKGRSTRLTEVFTYM
jgi:hypothetical protein